MSRIVSCLTHDYDTSWTLFWQCRYAIFLGLGHDVSVLACLCLCLIDLNQRKGPRPHQNIVVPQNYINTNITREYKAFYIKAFEVKVKFNYKSISRCTKYTIGPLEEAYKVQPSKDGLKLQRLTQVLNTNLQTI